MLAGLIHIFHLFTDICNLSTVLKGDELVTATSVWPIQKRNKKTVVLNAYQRKAIEMACSNDFAMIQGPPGQPIHYFEHNCPTLCTHDVSLS